MTVGKNGKCWTAGKGSHKLLTEEGNKQGATTAIKICTNEDWFYECYPDHDEDHEDHEDHDDHEDQDDHEDYEDHDDGDYDDEDHDEN